jgi:RNA polymerase sigma-70 factor, ECF subfamily
MEKTNLRLDDVILIKRINEGDRDAFTDLVNVYTRRLYYFAWQFVGDKQIAEDIVQDIFTEIWSKHRIWKPAESMYGYLIKSIKNRCLRYLEKQRPIPGSSMKLRKGPEFEDLVNVLVDTQSVARIENSLMQHEIMEALQTLPERCGLIFRMHRFEGISQRDIAKELNISIKTVGNQIQRAVEILYKKLKHHIE